MSEQKHAEAAKEIDLRQLTKRQLDSLYCRIAEEMNRRDTNRFMDRLEEAQRTQEQSG